jgi:hypothetical protein
MITHDFYQLLADTRVQAHIDATDTALDCPECRPTWGDLVDEYYYAHTEDYDAGYLTSGQLLEIARTWATTYIATALRIWARYDAEQSARGAE